MSAMMSRHYVLLHGSWWVQHLRLIPETGAFLQIPLCTIEEYCRKYKSQEHLLNGHGPDDSHSMLHISSNAMQQHNFEITS